MKTLGSGHLLAAVASCYWILLATVHPTKSQDFDKQTTGQADPSNSPPDHALHPDYLVAPSDYVDQRQLSYPPLPYYKSRLSRYRSALLAPTANMTKSQLNIYQITQPLTSTHKSNVTNLTYAEDNKTNNTAAATVNNQLNSPKAGVESMEKPMSTERLQTAVTKIIELIEKKAEPQTLRKTNLIKRLLTSVDNIGIDEMRVLTEGRMGANIKIGSLNVIEDLARKGRLRELSRIVEMHYTKKNATKKIEGKTVNDPGKAIEELTKTIVLTETREISVNDTAEINAVNSGGCSTTDGQGRHEEVANNGSKTFRQSLHPTSSHQQVLDIHPTTGAHFASHPRPAAHAPDTHSDSQSHPGTVLQIVPSVPPAQRNVKKSGAPQEQPTTLHEKPATPSKKPETPREQHPVTHEKPVASHNTSTARHKQRTITREKSAVSHETPAILHEHLANTHEHPTVPHNYVTVTREHSAALHEHPATSHEHLAIVHEHPGVEREHSAAPHEHPAAPHEHLVTAHEHPAAAHEHLATVHEHPAAPHEHLVTAHELPAAPHEHETVARENSSALHKHPAAPHEHLASAHEYPAAPHEHLAITHEHSSAPHEHLAAPHEHLATAHEHPTTFHEHPAAVHEHLATTHEYPAASHDHLATAHEHPVAPREHLAITHEHPAAPHEHSSVLHEHPAAPHEHLAITHEHSSALHEHLATAHDHPAAPHEHLATAHDHPAAPHKHLAAPHEHLATAHEHPTTFHEHPAVVHEHAPVIHEHRTITHVHPAVDQRHATVLHDKSAGLYKNPTAPHEEVMAPPTESMAPKEKPAVAHKEPVGLNKQSAALLQERAATQKLPSVPNVKTTTKSQIPAPSNAPVPSVYTTETKTLAAPQTQYPPVSQIVGHLNKATEHVPKSIMQSTKGNQIVPHPHVSVHIEKPQHTQTPEPTTEEKPSMAYVHSQSTIAQIPISIRSRNAVAQNGKGDKMEVHLPKAPQLAAKAHEKLHTNGEAENSAPGEVQLNLLYPSQLLPSIEHDFMLTPSLGLQLHVGGGSNATVEEVVSAKQLEDEPQKPPSTEEISSEELESFPPQNEVENHPAIEVQHQQEQLQTEEQMVKEILKRLLKIPRHRARPPQPPHPHRPHRHHHHRRHHHHLPHQNPLNLEYNTQNSWWKSLVPIPVFHRSENDTIDVNAKLSDDSTAIAVDQETNDSSSNISNETFSP